MKNRVTFQEWVVKKLKSQKLKINLLLGLTAVLLIWNTNLNHRIKILEHKMAIPPCCDCSVHSEALTTNEDLSSFDLVQLPMNLKPIKN